MIAGLYEAIRSGRELWPRVEAHYAKQWVNFQMRPHAHERCEVMYVFSGACAVSWGDGEPVGMRTGDFIFIDAGVPHRLIIPGGAPCTMLNVEFSFGKSEGGLFALPALCRSSADFARLARAQSRVISGSDFTGRLFRAMDDLVLELAAQVRDPAVVEAEMALFLLRLAQCARENENRVNADVYVRRTVEHIQHHFNDPLTVERLAGRAGVSAGHLGRIFKAATGETIHGFIARVRCDHAATLLARERAALDDIALQVGYASRQQLTRAFRARFGMAPREYRAQRKRGEA